MPAVFCWLRLQNNMQENTVHKEILYQKRQMQSESKLLHLKNIKIQITSKNSRRQEYRKY